ncbi:MAG: phage holin family protein [Bacteroidales bacterium]|nr:phage holin family protein [Bacteroidales bacterium]
MLNLNDLAKPAENLADDVKDYISMQEDRLKLETTKAASTSIARLLAMVLIILVAFVALLLLAFACVLLLGEAMKSYAGAAFIVTGVVAVLLLVLVLCKKKLFVNTFVKLFIDIFYGNGKE